MKKHILAAIVAAAFAAPVFAQQATPAAPATPAVPATKAEPAKKVAPAKKPAKKAKQAAPKGTEKAAEKKQ